MLTRKRVSHLEVRLTGMRILSHPGYLPESRENRKSDGISKDVISHRTIRGCPPGKPHPDLFPPKVDSTHKIARVIGQVKTWKWLFD